MGPQRRAAAGVAQQAEEWFCLDADIRAELEAEIDEWEGRSQEDRNCKLDDYVKDKCKRCIVDFQQAADSNARKAAKDAFDRSRADLRFRFRRFRQDPTRSAAADQILLALIQSWCRTFVAARRSSKT